MEFAAGHTLNKVQEFDASLEEFKTFTPQMQKETLWLTQKGMAELFGVVKSTINEHLSNIFKTNELQNEVTVRKFRTVQKEGIRIR